MNDATATSDALKDVKSFSQFYPLYLKEHSNRTCRRVHFIGSSLALICLVLAITRGQPLFILLGLICGYGFAWLGHFGFEKNKPASFKRPFYSFVGDWVMYKDIWVGRIKF
jgi:hypothetical protein